jgi:NADH dehydrogenase FAD-containing subunit
MEKFDVREQPLSYITQLCPNVRVHQAKLVSINVACRTAKLSDGDVLKYDRLCLCAGAKPSVSV